jgi:flagellar protein FlgJ
VIRKVFLTALEEGWAGAANLNCNKAVCFAQAVHESNWGSSRLTRYNNLFGIKATRTWKGDTINIQGFEWDAELKKMIPCMIKWRAYPSYAECITNYSQILNLNKCYRPALNYLNNPDQFLSVVAKHWATDPKYYQKVISIGKEIESIGGPTWAKQNMKGGEPNG